MKTPESMTRGELLEYVSSLKKMIHTLQVTLTKALEAVAEERRVIHMLDTEKVEKDLSLVTTNNA